MRTHLTLRDLWPAVVTTVGRREGKGAPAGVASDILFSGSGKAEGYFVEGGLGVGGGEAAEEMAAVLGRGRGRGRHGGRAG